MANFITQRYSRRGLWSLFLMCAFPIHLWTLILSFRDVSWVSQRTNTWDAIGVVSYGMLFAFVESILLFLVFTLLGFILPKHWSVDKRIGFLALLSLVTSLWAMLSQLLFLWDLWLPAAAIEFLRDSGHPLRILYVGSLAIVTTTISIPVYWFLRMKKAVAIMEDIIERLSLLTMLYLCFDLLGVIMILARNLLS